MKKAGEIVCVKINNKKLGSEKVTNFERRKEL
jgi:hypothetical protein